MNDLFFTLAKEITGANYFRKERGAMITISCKDDLYFIFQPVNQQ